MGVKPVGRKALHQSVVFLKQNLEDEEVESFAWKEGKDIIAGVFTKQGSNREMLKEVIKEG